MATFYDGTTDSIATAALSRIVWRITFNTMRGSCPDDDLFRKEIPGAAADENGVYPSNGKFTIINPPMAGNQSTRIGWYTDEGTIYLRIFSVSEPY